MSFALFMMILAAAAHYPVWAEDLVYVAVNPCRIVDTRIAGGAITANTFRNFRVAGTTGELAVQGGQTDCLDPKSGTGQKPLAISAYVIAVPATGSTGGVLTAYPSNLLPPPPGAGSTVNFATGQVIGNTTNITLCDQVTCPADGEFAILARNTNQHVVIDVQGYFYPQRAGQRSIFIKANEQNIGVLIQAHNEPLIFAPGRFQLLLEALSFNEYRFTVDAGTGELLNVITEIFFANPDCTGQRYIRPTLYLPIPSPTIETQGQVMRTPDFLNDPVPVYYVPRGTESVSVSPQSYYNSSEGETCVTSSGSVYLYTLFPNDPAITGVENSYPTPIRIGY